MSTIIKIKPSANKKVDVSEKKLVQGLIDRDAELEQVFVSKYRQQIYAIFSSSYEKMEFKTELTDQMKEELFDALFENLHSSEDKQLKRFLSEERQCSLDAFLDVKARLFLRDKLLVKGLKDRDERITKRVFYGDDYLSFQPIMKKILNEKDIRNPEQGNMRMSAEDFASEMYSETMKQIDNFRFECSLKSFFIGNVVRSYLKKHFEKLKKDRQEVDFMDYENVEAFDTIDYVEYDRKAIRDYFEELFALMIQDGVNPTHIEVLQYKYIDELSAREIADLMGITENLVNQWVYRTMHKLIKAARKFGK